MVDLSNSRFNPKPGIMDFWSEFRKPNPYRWPILVAASMPFAVIFWWLSGEVAYKEPERPNITYIETFSPDRTDAEIIASNEANQEVKELREAAEKRLAERKREMYKALGSAVGMDVDSIEKRADAERAKAEAEAKKRQDEMFGEEGAPATDDASDADENGTAP